MVIQSVVSSLTSLITPVHIGIPLALLCTKWASLLMTVAGEHLPCG